MRRPRLASACLAALLLPTLLLSTVGCGSAAGVSDADRGVLAQLAEIAPRDSEVDGEVTGTACWLPSASMIDERRFRVLCRVQYEQAGSSPASEPVARHRDMICIGDPDRDPVAEYCYRWAFYSDMPAFEDQPAFSAG